MFASVHVDIILPYLMRLFEHIVSFWVFSYILSPDVTSIVHNQSMFLLIMCLCYRHYFIFSSNSLRNIPSQFISMNAPLFATLYDTKHKVSIRCEEDGGSNRHETEFSLTHFGQFVRDSHMVSRRVFCDCTFLPLNSSGRSVTAVFNEYICMGFMAEC